MMLASEQLFRLLISTAMVVTAIAAVTLLIMLAKDWITKKLW